MKEASLINNCYIPTMNQTGREAVTCDSIKNDNLTPFRFYS